MKLRAVFLVILALLLSPAVYAQDCEPDANGFCPCDPVVFQGCTITVGDGLCRIQECAGYRCNCQDPQDAIAYCQLTESTIYAQAGAIQPDGSFACGSSVALLLAQSAASPGPIVTNPPTQSPAPTARPTAAPSVAPTSPPTSVPSPTAGTSTPNPTPTPTATNPPSASPSPTPTEAPVGVRVREVYKPGSGFIIDAVKSGAPGDNNVYVVFRAGEVRVLSSTYQVLGTLLSIAVNSGGEGGLLGVAFHPDYATNGYVFIYYTPGSGVFRTTISRFTVTNKSPPYAAGSEKLIHELIQPYSNHNGGSLRFDQTTGYLLAGIGDGGSGGDPQCRAQDRTNAFGSIIRLDIDPADDSVPYLIPPTNPYANNAQGFAPEIFAYGLRNPWRISTSTDGKLWISDVGQGTWEEIDRMNLNDVSGRNFGWKIMEGSHCFGTCPDTITTLQCDDPSLTLPLLEYDHSGGSCSISGGAVYERNDIPWLNGKFIFTDFCDGRLWTMEPNPSYPGSGLPYIRELLLVSSGSEYLTTQAIFVTTARGNNPFWFGLSSALYEIEADV
mmetsp:Transcript_18734/g.32525  ORF Transcript_18734/g.32525 Transcript_18734/m.32525 type:complete len:555 (-) Transcript_18734:164-1828(-)